MEHKHGCGKWMLFVNASDVDAIWRRIVTALWDGKLGHSAKVSGNTPESNGSHVICVYVDPFWDVDEVERVLAALRSECGIADSIKFKADGVTMHSVAGPLHISSSSAVDIATTAANMPPSAIVASRSTAQPR